VVNDEHVTVQNLENADRVIRTDPLYRLDDEDESDEEKDDHGVSGAWDLDVNVSIEDNEIETVIDDIMDGHSNNVKATQPNEYSYRTWELTDDYSYPILGMTDDIPSSSRVLSPPLIDSLRKYLPYSISEDLFWLKYNLSRDGANLQSLYHCIRQCPRTLLAIETTNGEIYGSCEAFLWRLKESRFSETNSLEEQARLEDGLQVYKWSQENRIEQILDRTKLAVGGGFPDDDDGEEKRNWGFGIALGSDLWQIVHVSHLRVRDYHSSPAQGRSSK
jgi:hypothetical protein